MDHQICPKCGGTGYYKFCPHCGTRMGEFPVCKVCGEKLWNFMKHCPGCGGRREDIIYYPKSSKQTPAENSNKHKHDNPPAASTSFFGRLLGGLIGK